MLALTLTLFAVVWFCGFLLTLCAYHIARQEVPKSLYNSLDNFADYFSFYGSMFLGWPLIVYETFFE
jgi:hypothetical protein